MISGKLTMIYFNYNCVLMVEDRTGGFKCKLLQPDSGVVFCREHRHCIR